MRILLIILCFVFCINVDAQTLVGYIKNSGSFTNTAAIGLTNITTQAFITGRNPGQVGIGDVMKDNGGTPINGGFTWWGFSKTSGGTSRYRGYKIDNSGVVLDEVVQGSGPDQMIPCGYHNNSGAANCAGGGSYINPIYGPIDDPGIYENKGVYSSSGGATFTNGTPFTVAFLSGGSSFWTFIYSSTNSKATSVACCAPNSPISYAGPDMNYNLLVSQIPLNGIGIDCDGTWTYSWSRISGPNTPTINDNTAAVTFITGFIVGTYVYRLTVTDNAAHSTTDDVSITVYPTPLDTDPHKMVINLDQVYGMEGEDYRGVVGSSWYYFDMGTADPRNGSNPTGKYDYDSVTAGWQNKPNSGRLQRLTHDFTRADLPSQYQGRGVMVEFDTVKYFGALHIYDTTGAAGLTVKFYIGNKTKIRQARWQQEFGDLAPDYTYTTKSIRGWDSIILTGQDSGQYFYAVFSNFAIDVAIIPYGKNSPFGTSDTSINRRRYTNYTDTVGSIKDMMGANSAGALPLNNPHYFRDSLPWYFNGLRAYNAPFGQGPPLSSVLGMIDPDSTAWILGNPVGNTNRIDVGPFGNGTGPFNPYIVDSLHHRVDGFPLLQNMRGANGFHVSHSLYNGEIKPKNDVISNIRSRKGWERYAYALECIVAKFYQNSSPSNPSKYRYQNDRWPGQFGLNFFTGIIEPDNEKDEGFRTFPPDSSYMRPEELMFQQSIAYDTLKALQPSLIVLTQAFVSYNISPLRAEIKNAYLYYGNRRQICDAVSMHTTITVNNFDHTPTSTDLCGQHGDFPGTNNERLKMANYILDIDREFGKHVPWYLTEWGYTKDSIGPTDCVNFTDAFYSLIGAPQVKSHTKYENHAILNFQAFIHYAGVPGLRATDYYTIADAGDTSSVFEKNSDFSNGLTNYANVPRILHPAYWYNQSFLKRFNNWKFSTNVQNNSGGVFVDKWIERSNPDSAMYIVFNQGRNDALSTTSLSVGTSITCTKYQPSFTSFNMASSSQSISSSHIVVTARPEGDAYVYYDANLPPIANAGADQGIILPINSVIVDGSASHDPDGSIVSYAWSKISGPSTYTIESPSSAISIIDNLVAGTYVFRLTVTDDRGATGTDDITISVLNPISPAMIWNQRIIIIHN